MEDRRLRQWIGENGQLVKDGFQYEDGILRINRRIYVPNCEELTQNILDEAH